jgi:hypothetical protein
MNGQNRKIFAKDPYLGYINKAEKIDEDFKKYLDELI